MNELVIKTFNEKKITAHIDENGDPWFISSEVMEILGIKNQAHALRKLDQSERGEVKLQGESGFRQKATVTESGLYALIMQSKVKTAQDFRRWVTKEVLPSIRKSGSYSVSKKEMSPLDILENHVRQMRILESTTENLARQVEVLTEVSKQDDDTLTSDQIGRLDMEIAKRATQLGDVSYVRFIRWAIKNKFFAIKGSRTYKEIARRDFEEGLRLVSSFRPQPWMIEKLQQGQARQ